jgi:hypothetical protein
MDKWTKKLDEIHYTKTEDGMTRTLCGRPCISNNYIDCYKEIDKMIGRERQMCKKCGAKANEQNIQ